MAAKANRGPRQLSRPPQDRSVPSVRRRYGSCPISTEAPTRIPPKAQAAPRPQPNTGAPRPTSHAGRGPRKSQYAYPAVASIRKPKNLPADTTTRSPREAALAASVKRALASRIEISMAIPSSQQFQRRRQATGWQKPVLWSLRDYDPWHTSPPAGTPTEDSVGADKRHRRIPAHAPSRPRRHHHRCRNHRLRHGAQLAQAWFSHAQHRPGPITRIRIYLVLRRHHPALLLHAGRHLAGAGRPSCLGQLERLSPPHPRRRARLQPVRLPRARGGGKPAPAENPLGAHSSRRALRQHRSTRAPQLAARRRSARVWAATAHRRRRIRANRRHRDRRRRVLPHRRLRHRSPTSLPSHRRRTYTRGRHMPLQQPHHRNHPGPRPHYRHPPGRRHPPRQPPSW